MVPYVDIRQRALKPRDSIAEVFLNDPVTMRIAYLMSRHLPAIKPLHVTVLSFLLRLAAAVCFAAGGLIAGAVLAYMGFLCDGIDGKLSRIRYGYDPEIRGTTDFVLDQIAFACMAIGMLIFNITIGAIPWLLLLGVWFALSYIVETLTSTRYRLLSVGTGEIATTLIRNKHVHGSVGPYLRIALRLHDYLSDALGRFRLSLQMTTVESEVLLFTLAPLLGFPLWIGIMALLPLIMTIFMYGSAIIILLLETTNTAK